MNFLSNFDLLSVGLTTAAIGFLAFIVYFNNRKSVTNQAFLFFACITIIWGWVNYSNYQVHEPTMALWLTRLTIFLVLGMLLVFFNFFMFIQILNLILIKYINFYYYL